MSHPYVLADQAEIFSPSLIVFPEIIKQNLASILKLAGSTDRLRPHIKTHKTREIVQMQLDARITKHKCATIAEAELLAETGAPDVLIAYPLVGPNWKRLTALVRQFPNTQFSTLIDQPAAAFALSAAALRAERSIGFFIDLDVGQHRTGLRVSDGAVALYEQAAKLPNVIPMGLHAYDGHNHQESHEERESAAKEGLSPVLDMRRILEGLGFPVPSIVAGGTPTFPIYASMTHIPGLECSPGTFILHDHGYGSRYHDLPGVQPAAVLLTRVISRPTADRVTFDLGNKAVAADPLMVKRVKLLDVPEYTIVGHNEEHLIIETAEADRFAAGDVAYALPGHICPTVALHKELLVAEGGRIVGTWRVAARDRMLSI